MTTYIPLSWALWALAIGITLAFLCGRHYRNARRLLKARANARKEFAHVFKRCFEHPNPAEKEAGK